MLLWSTVLAAATGLCWLGSDLLVSSLIVIGEVSGIPESALGVLVSAPGTSLPEFGSSLVATFVEHKPDVGVGCVVGSNVYNLCGILGIAALTVALKLKKPIEVSKYPLIDTTISAAITGILLVIIVDRTITRWEGLIFFLIYCVYAYALIRWSKRQREGHKKKRVEEYKKHAESAEISQVSGLGNRDWFMVLAKLAAGIALFVVSVRLLVKSTVKLATILGYPSSLLGYTVLAIATSLPETFTTVNAALKDHGDLAVTNIVGSNNFNILMGLGIPAIGMGSIAATNADKYLVAVLLGATLAALPFTARRKLGLGFAATMFAFYGLFLYATITLIH
ncbi:calcium/sodium antiporter [Methanopyrus sp.]